VSERAFYLDGPVAGVFALLNEPRNAGTARPVLLLAPFGWEDMCSYRSRREWALHLAAGGRTVLRIDLPGSGDSAGRPADPGLVASWLAAVEMAARWLAARTGTDAVAAIGPGLGGLLACAAASRGAPIDELVLWNAPASGRAVVRAVKAAGVMEVSARGDAAGRRDDGTLAASGYALSAATAGELADLGVGAPAIRRALLLGRDGLPVDKELVTALTAARVEVSSADGPGYGQMTIEPQDARPPMQVFELVDEWLSPQAAPRESPPACQTVAKEQLELDGLAERPLRIDSPSGPLFGILTEPETRSGDLAVLFLNAGPQRRSGPNRMWVEAARRWADAGVPSLRVDLRAIGDSDGDASALARIDAFYTDAYVAQTHAVLDELERRGLGPRIMVVGLCAGCYWATHAAQADRRITTLALLNPRSLVWDEGATGMRRARELRRMMARRSSWARLLRGQVTPARHLETARAVATEARSAPVRMGRRLGGRGHTAHPATELFDGLRDQDQQVTLVFTTDEPLLNELRARGHGDLSDWPNLKLEEIDTGTEAHTLVPLGAQRRVHEILDATLASARDQPRGDGDAASASAI